MSNTYHIDSFHLGLGVVGDSAIQLLIQDRPLQPGLVIFALLVDGGESGGDARLVKTINYIQTAPSKYDLSSISSKTPPTLQFNAVVISHWDSDHWAGVLSAMRKDIVSQQTIPNNPVTDFEISFFQYNPGTGGKPRTPKTILYCPAFGLPTAKGSRISPQPPTAASAYANFILGAGKDGKTMIVNNAVKVKMEPVKTPANKDPTLIGTNLVTGKALSIGISTVDSYQSVTSPTDLVTKNPPGDSQPGIYIVGASARVIGPVTGVGVVNDPKGTAKNKSSIACMIMWAAAPSGGLARLSHYFAGDMHWDDEKRLVHWSGANGDRTQVGRWIPTIKTSHHGSKSSTPVSMLTGFNPRCLVASVGERNGHPSWELMFYLEGWLYSDDLAKAAIPPLLATQFPYYLILEYDPSAQNPQRWLPLPRNKSNQMSMNVLVDQGKVATDYKDELKLIYGMAGKAMAKSSAVDLTDPSEAWSVASAANKDLDAKDWARSRIAAAWPRLSATPPSAHAAVGQARVSTNHQLVYPSNALAWFRVECHNDSNLDGTVHVKYDAAPSEIQLYPSPLFVPPTMPGATAMAIPADPILGKKRRYVDTYTPAACATDPVTKKHKSQTFDSVSQNPKRPGKKSALGISTSEDTVSNYAPAPGTNVNENDDMLSDDEISLARPLTTRLAVDGSPIMDPQPAPGLPGPPHGTPPALQAPFFYICASTVEYDTPPSPALVSQLASTDPLNNFLSTFHMQGVILSNAPQPSVPMSLHSQDEFQAWLVVALMGGGTVNPSATITTGSTTSDIEGFTVVIPDLGSTFSSAATTTALNIQPDQGLGPASTVPWQNSLILGLEKADKTSGISLIDILAPASVRSAKLTGLQLLQLALGKQLQFDLDVRPGSRNAIWFDPMIGYKTVVRSQYVADSTSLSNMNGWIGKCLNGFTVQSLTVITKLQSSWVSTSAMPGALNAWEFILITTVQLQNISVAPTVTFDFAGSVLTITLQFDYIESDNGNLLTQILNWIVLQIPHATFDFNQWLGTAGPTNFDAPLFRRLILIVQLDPITGLPTLGVDDMRIDLELGVKFGQTDDNPPPKVVFLFTYEWNTTRGSSLRGSLWIPPPPAEDVNRILMSDYELHLQFEPCSINVNSLWAPTLNLANLIPSDNGGKIVNIPEGIPTDVTMAVLEIDSTSISFQGALECSQPTSDSIPVLVLSRMGLNASYTFSTKDFNVYFDFAAAMYPQISSGILPIELRGSVAYDSKAGWDAQADVDCPGMQGAHFLNYLSDSQTVDAGPSSTALIQHIRLIDLHLEYQYQAASGNTGAAKSFIFSGSLAVGKLELDLAFNYTGANTWTFEAHAGASGESTTIQEILDSILMDGSVNLPSCVGSILVGKPNVVLTASSTPRFSPQPGATSSPSPARRRVKGQDDPPRDFFDLALTRLGSNVGGTGVSQDIIFTVSVNVGHVAFTFLQYRNSSWAVDTVASKRFLRVEVNSIPTIDIPIIGDLTQPFDEMYFMWVQDGSNTTAKGSPPGLTKAEVAVLNGVLKDDPIYYKLTKDINDYVDTDVIVQAGCHFVLVLKDQQNAPNVVLDYVFAQPTPTSTVPAPAEALKAHALHQRRFGANAVISSQPLPSRNSLGQDDDPQSAEPIAADAGGGTTKAAMKKSIGPFSISNIGLRFSNSKLSVCLDAEVVIGPIGMAMMGFSIDLNMSGGHNLQNNFPTPLNDGITFSLSGLTASFNRPPLTIAGGLIKEALRSGTFYAGGVSIGFEAWAFLAAGGYGELTDPNTQNPFKSVFIFAQLDGPLVTLEFATISGVTGGFGYNNALTLPTVAEVPTFPFLHMPASPTPPPTGDPTMDTLMSLINSKWFNPLDGSFWVAAGLTVTAFQMLNITAVVVVEWDTDVKLGIYAVAIADVPSTDAPFKIAHIELGILAMVDFGQGVAKFEAQLAPSSFILDPLCKLSGGFALYYWFKSGAQQINGDWVFTIGGYHQLYKPPPQYPVPPRLQISWSLGPLSITGQAYFAITPNVAMAGGELHASLSIGVLKAFFDAYADFLINFKPFTFMASGGISVGVRFTLDLWFVTIHISVEIGATLVLQGPPISGTCHVNFWVFGFDIHFGSDQVTSPTPISLEEFYDLVLQKGSPTAATTTPVPQLFACKSGLIPSSPSSNSKMARRRQAAKAGTPARLVTPMSPSKPSITTASSKTSPSKVKTSSTKSKSSPSKASSSSKSIVSPPKTSSTSSKSKTSPSKSSSSSSPSKSKKSISDTKVEPALRVTKIDDDDDDDDSQIWEVKAGTFTFSINTVFALSTVTVYPTSTSPLVYNAPHPDTTNIYSRPMYLKNSGAAITSNLKVTMTIETGDSQEDYEPQWEIQPIINSVPRALWDAYDATADPTTGSTSLLDSKASPTVPLMMGVLFIPPLPLLSGDRIQPFDAVLSQLQNVLNPPPPFPDSTTTGNPAWLPIAPSPPPPSDPAKPWEDVQALWEKPNLDDGTGAAAVTEWAQAMGWDDRGIDGTVPIRLIDDLQNLYVAAPMIGASVPAISSRAR